MTYKLKNNKDMKTKNYKWEIISILISVSGWIIQPLIEWDILKLRIMLEALPYITFIIGVGMFIYIKLKKKFEQYKFYQNQSLEKINKKINDNKRDDETVLKDHALRLHFINKCLMFCKVDKVHYEQLGLLTEDLKNLGFDMKTIVKVKDKDSKDEDRILSITKIKNHNIKGQ